MADFESVLADLDAEGESCESLVGPIEAGLWARGTPAPGWSIAHQIGHLAWTDRASITAATDPDGFARLTGRAMADPEGFVDAAAAEWSREEPAALLERWRAGRAELIEVLRARPPGEKVPWFGPPMSPVSMATARIMETWAHGEDIADALGVAREPTARLRNVAHIGVRTRDFAFTVHGLAVPAEPFRVELAAPAPGASGELPGSSTMPDDATWTWGPADAAQRVCGLALDFCLLVTQRRHPDDLALVAEGPDARTWMTIAQAFAGAPGAGRAPRG